MEYKVIKNNGTTKWYKPGTDIRHREDEPALERADGSKAWYQEGLRHRQDGPAFEWADGLKVWYKEGELHRLDGPAIERADGTKAWFIEDVEYTEEEFLKKTTTKKMTVAELEEALGHSLEIIKD